MVGLLFVIVRLYVYVLAAAFGPAAVEVERDLRCDVADRQEMTE